MTADGPWEIPPLDDAPDISRSTELQPGETLADARNWAGFGLLFIGVLVAVVAAAVAAWGFGAGALVLAVFAAVSLVAGAALIVLEWLRKRARNGNGTTDEAPAWQVVVPRDV